MDYFNKFRRFFHPLHIFYFIFLPLMASMTVAAQAENLSGSPALLAPEGQDLSNGSGDWYMAAANPERTSWTTEEVRGWLNPLWFKPFDAYIPPRVQIIAINNMLLISTAEGLYALNATTGAQCWVYPTEYPLGHSPTVVNGVAYVGGFDKKIHAVTASSCSSGGQRLWTFEAGAGFDTNPLVVNNLIFAGNRDGKFYAVHATGTNAGKEAWSYQTGGPIHYSAAYKNGVVYFASDDSFAYALNAQSGALVWKSAKLPGSGFHSWWPVIYKDKVIFSGSNNYRASVTPGSLSSKLFTSAESDEVFPNRATDPRGTLVGALGSQPGNWSAGTPTVNVNRIINYFNQKPYRRSVFVLNQSTGAEPDKSSAPVLWTGTHSGNRYPPVIGSDGVLYQQNNYKSDPFINGGHIAGWEPGNRYISMVSSDWAAVDEPHAASGGGNLIYWNLCCDRQAGAFDITIPYQGGGLDTSREWYYFNYDLNRKIPNYNQKYTTIHNDPTSPYANFGDINGIYGFHGDTNPPIPYNGRVYLHRSNTIIAFAPGNHSPTQLATAPIVSAQPELMSPLGIQGLQAEITTEVQKIINAGHLKPGYASHGIFDLSGAQACGDNLIDYFANSGETIYTLAMAYPYLSPSLQQSVKTYLQNEYNNYPPYLYDHIGWNTGAQRETFIVPPEVASQMAGSPASQENSTFKNNGGWQRNPFAFYALWKYADLMGNPTVVWNASQSAFWNEFNRQMTDNQMLKNPLMHNAYIAGYTGWLELESAAGKGKSANVQNELNRLLQMRANNFTQNTAYTVAGQPGAKPYCRTLNISSNFMYMVPELANYLQTHALNKVTTAVNTYEIDAPYWFVNFFEAGYAENVLTPLYDGIGLFTAKSWILDTPGEQMEKLIDGPAFPVGDLYYLQKLVMSLENQSYGFGMSLAWPNSGVLAVDAGGVATFNFLLQPSGGFSAPITLSVLTLPPNFSASFPDNPITPPGTGRVQFNDHSGVNSSPKIYTMTIRATGDSISQDQTIKILVNPERSFMPLVAKQ